MNFTYLLLFEIFIIFHTLSRDSNHVPDDPTFYTGPTRVQTSVIGPLLAKPTLYGAAKSGLAGKIMTI